MFLPVHGRGDSGSGLAIAQSTQAFQFTLDEQVINVDWKFIVCRNFELTTVGIKDELLAAVAINVACEQHGDAEIEAVRHEIGKRNNKAMLRKKRPQHVALLNQKYDY
ncbi:hypothetical protein WR25_25598 [Diploscapter pachys]|uniref:Uncharacterized protein n=1 Tax=Diploscapter pachys TaxID=2018661 RepID=A0A2A2JYX9_9BILA|nr:hypothetical protein WR25_25598 [Diploscapter pachys]